MSDSRRKLRFKASAPLTLWEVKGRDHTGHVFTLEGEQYISVDGYTKSENKFSTEWFDLIEFIPDEPEVPADQQLHVAGAKADAGKLRAGLVFGGFSRALAAVAQVGTFGANKYTANGWLTVPNGLERYEDAGERHRLERRQGIERDTESQLLHRAHEAWNALATLELELRASEA